ncbi:DUF1971 domain-containing protein [Novosphingobium sp. B 225]|uniref:DUF1971 domain-containing protein n=1 Tax=Novosphingobium sp. B 225 TaxID=1961849 RepID=UPI000B4BE252
MHPHLTEADLERVIPAFYARVREDALIGPVFNQAIADWPHHLQKLVAFWSSVMRSTGRYKGSPMAAHARHRNTITPEMFTRWLALWSEVTSAMLNEQGAAAMQAKAALIADSLQLGLFFRLDPKASPQPYKITAEWDEVSLPQAIRSRHNTKPGTWGLLRVLAGSVNLMFEDPPRRVHVTPDSPAEIPPQAWHHVEVTGPMRMLVEFYRDQPQG